MNGLLRRGGLTRGQGQAEQILTRSQTVSRSKMCCTKDPNTWQKMCEGV